jgi:pyridinium-3,5-biscarboxylic acid mononucleotide synthase
MKSTTKSASRGETGPKGRPHAAPSVAHLARHTAASSAAPVEGIAQVDVSRSERTAFPEVIFCENKRLDQILAIAERLYAHTKQALGTRCPPDFFPALKKSFPRGHFVPEARSFRIGRPRARIAGASAAIISAGTTDIPVCEEAALVLESLGVETHRIYDVGVAGIHRLFAKDALIRRSDVLIAVAGMEGALPSVLGGLYPQPIIAVPTSNGYGAALAGFTALLAMLTGCAPGVTVVNIDNGVGAAAAAFKILNLIARMAGSDSN